LEGLVFFSDNKMKTSDTARHRWVATSGGNESWRPTSHMSVLNLKVYNYLVIIINFIILLYYNKHFYCIYCVYMCKKIYYFSAEK